MSDLTEIIDRQKKEIVEFINGVSRESYHQGRADAISECLEIIKNSYRMDAVEKIEKLKENTK